MKTATLKPAAENYVGLARSIARHFASGDVDNSDAFGEALVALVEASESWTPEKNTEFTTYARRCMFNALISSHRKRHLRVSQLSEEPVANGHKFYVDPSVVDELLRLPEPEQDLRDHIILMDYYLGDKSYAEVGKDYGLTPMAVFYAVKRGIARIRRDHARLLASDFFPWALPIEG